MQFALLGHWHAMKPYWITISCIGMALGCGVSAEPETQHDGDMIAPNGQEYINPAWHISPSVGRLVLFGDDATEGSDGTATLIQVGNSPSSATLLATSHQFLYANWEYQTSADLFYVAVFSVEREAQSIDVIIPLQRARVFTDSKAENDSQGYAQDFAIAQLGYRIGAEHLGPQPLPRIGVAQPRAKADLNGWVLGYGHSYCDDVDPQRYAGLGIKRATSFLWPGPEVRWLFLQANRRRFDRRHQVAACHGDSGGPLMLASQPGSERGYIDTATGREFRLNTVLGVVSSIIGLTKDGVPSGFTAIADVVGNRTAIESVATSWESQQIPSLPSIDALTECLLLAPILQVSRPFTTTEFCQSVSSYSLCDQHSSLEQCNAHGSRCAWYSCPDKPGICSPRGTDPSIACH